MKGIGLKLVSKCNGNNMKKHPWSSQGRLSKNKRPAGCGCSGTKISARAALAAGHCLISNKSVEANAKCWLPGADGVVKAVDSSEDGAPNGYGSRAQWFVSTGWLEDESPLCDWGVFILRPKRNICKLGWLGYKAASNYNKGVNIFGHPGGSGIACEGSPFTSNKRCHSLCGDTGHVSDAHEHCFHAHVDTAYGMSGAGACEKDGARHVIGLHVRSVEGNKRGEATRVNKALCGELQEIWSQCPDSDC